MTLVESFRTNVTAAGLRMAYFATVQNYYRWYIDLLMRMHRESPSAGFDLQALEVSERSRARGLLDRLNEAGADVMADVDRELSERYRRVRQMLSFNATRRLELPATATDERRRLGREITALLADYEAIEADLKAGSPRYAALVEPRPLHYDQIQALLDPDTTLLMYVMGEERAYAWVVTASVISVTELSDLQTLVGLARSAEQTLEASPFDPVRRPQADTGRTRVPGSLPAVMALSEAVLGPVAGALKTRRLAIVAAGALEYVPIGALPSPRSLPRLNQIGEAGSADSESERLPVLSAVGPSYRPLLADREVIYLPSPSTLGRLRADAARRAPTKTSIAILADPVFADDDPRVLKRTPASSKVFMRGTGATGGAASSVVEAQPARESSSGGGVLPRLPSTRREAEMIAAIAGDSTLLALDFEATRAKAMDPALRDYSIIHFATHALIDDRYPELAGVVLSRVTADGLPQDGFLRLQDIYALRLAAEMVVLSACRTALGPEIHGEGLVGLVRGFMSAGAPRVLASLWTVDDAATAELMTEFYTALLRDRLPASVALQRAQRHMWQQPRWRAPFYWAAFVLQGDWK
jgi:hypothetical protein